MCSYEAIRDFFGEELTPVIAHRFANAPLEQIATLFSYLSGCYYDSFDTLTTTLDPMAASGKRYHCVDPFPEELSLERQAERSKTLLLYFPSITVPDPLAKVSWPIITVAALTNEMVIPDEQKFRLEIREALTLLAEIAPLLKDGSALLISEPFVLDNPKLQEAARTEMDARPDRKELSERLDEQMVIGGITAQGQICKTLDLVPLTSTKIAQQALDSEYIKASQRGYANVELRTANTLFSHSLPGFRSIDAALIAELRKNESAFAEWRTAFQDVLERVDSEGTSDAYEFERELKQASMDLLTPKIKEIDKALNTSPVLTKLISPALLTLGAGAATAHFTNQSFAPSVIASASTAPISWIIDRLYTRYKKSGRNRALLREVYCHALRSEDGANSAE